MNNLIMKIMIEVRSKIKDKRLKTEDKTPSPGPKTGVVSSRQKNIRSKVDGIPDIFYAMLRKFRNDVCQIRANM